MTGGYADVFAVAASSNDLYGYSPEPTKSANRIDFVVTVHPSAALTGGTHLNVLATASRCAASADHRRENLFRTFQNASVDSQDRRSVRRQPPPPGTPGFLAHTTWAQVAP